MSARHVVVLVLLWLGVGLELLACLGTLAMRSVFDRLHFSSPAALGLILIALAVLVDKDFSLIGDKSLLIAALVLIGSPLVTHAIGRTARIVERGDWRVGDGEDVEVEGR